MAPRSPDALINALAGASSATLIYSLPAADGDTSVLWDVLGTARARGTRVTLIAVAVAGHSSYAAVFEGARAGVGALLMATPLLNPAELTIALAESARTISAESIWAQLRNELTTPSTALESLLRRTLSLAHAPVTLPALAEACQMHERSLRKYCVRHALPEPQRVIAWARMLWCAYSLDAGATLTQATEDLGFPSVDAVRKLVWRMLQSGLSTLPPQPLVTTVSRRLATELHHGEPAGQPILRLLG